nr:uncharacterized protein LOC108056052 [Drosophila takahashii]
MAQSTALYAGYKSLSQNQNHNHNQIQIQTQNPNPKNPATDADLTMDLSPPPFFQCSSVQRSVCFTFSIRSIPRLLDGFRFPPSVDPVPSSNHTKQVSIASGGFSFSSARLFVCVPSVLANSALSNIESITPFDGHWPNKIGKV